MKFFLASTCSLFFASSALAQSSSDMINLFGGIIRSGVAMSAQVAWQKLPPDQLACVDQALRQQGLSLNLAIQQGIVPTDSRVLGVRSACRGQSPVQTAATGTSVLTNYTVDGLALGSGVAFGSTAYSKYSCTPSEQFAGFTICKKKTEERDPRGPYASSVTLLHSDDGTVGYVNRFLEPAFFAPGEAEADIDRLSKKYGAPKIRRIPPEAPLASGMIASWGQISLDPIGPDLVAELAAGRDVRAGFMVDHIGDFHRSAQLGLPIYRLSGGPGFVWAASWGTNQKGTLRFLAANPAFYDQSAAERIAAEQEAERKAAQKAAAEKAAAERAATEKAAAERAAAEKAATEKAKADEAMRRAEQELALQNEARDKGKEYAQTSGTSWSIIEKKNEMTDGIDVTVKSIQRNEGVAVEVIGSCKTNTVTFSGLLVGEDGKGLNVPGQNSEIGGAPVLYRVNDAQPVNRVLPTLVFSNQYEIVRLANKADSNDVDDLAHLIGNAIGIGTTLRPAFIWRIMAEFKTTVGSIVVKIPLFDNKVRQLITSCVR